MEEKALREERVREGKEEKGRKREGDRKGGRGPWRKCANGRRWARTGH